MKCSKNLVRLIVTFALSFGLLVAVPAVAQAADTGLTADSAAGLKAGATADSNAAGALQTQAVKKYNVWIGGKQVTSKNAKNVLGNGTVSYNAKTNTLTLKNAKITRSQVVKSGTRSWRYGIYSRQNKSLTVVLKGTNTIKVPGRGTVASYGISVADASGNPENLLIKGSGSLKVQAGKAGLFSFGILCQNFNLQGSAKVTACGGTMVKTSAEAASSVGSYVGSCGVTALGFLALHDSVQLTATGKTRALNKAATYSQGYTPRVKAGASSKSIKVNKKNPASSVYTSYKYVSISKAAKKSTSSKKPASTFIISVSTGTQSAKVTWQTVSKNCTGYEIQVSDSSTFTGNVYTKRLYLGHQNTSSINFTFNPGGKLYYFRVRAVNHISDAKEYKSAWSAYVPAYVSSGQAAG